MWAEKAYQAMVPVRINDLERAGCRQWDVYGPWSSDGSDQQCKSPAEAVGNPSLGADRPSLIVMVDGSKAQGSVGNGASGCAVFPGRCRTGSARNLAGNPG